MYFCGTMYSVPSTVSFGSSSLYAPCCHASTWYFVAASTPVHSNTILSPPALTGFNVGHWLTIGIIALADFVNDFADCFDTPPDTITLPLSSLTSLLLLSNAETWYL